MTPAALPIWHWALFAVAASAYLLLAAWRKNVSLRPLRLGWLAAAAVVGRAALLLVVQIEWWEWLPLAGCLVGAANAPWLQRCWMIRAPHDEFRQRLEDACRGLRLEFREPVPGRIELIQRQEVLRLRVIVLAPACLLVHLPRAARPSKVALLVDWLAKQYPGPVPRIHIHLSGES